MYGVCFLQLHIVHHQIINGRVVFFPIRMSEFGRMGVLDKHSDGSILTLLDEVGSVVDERGTSDEEILDIISVVSLISFQMCLVQACEVGDLLSGPGFPDAVRSIVASYFVHLIPQNPVNEAPQKLCSPVSVRWVATYSGDIVDEIQPGSVLLICEERRLVLLDREGISIHVRLILWWAVYVV